MKLYQLARVLMDNTPIVVFTLDRDADINGEFERLAKELRYDDADWEVIDAEPDGNMMVVSVLSHKA